MLQRYLSTGSSKALAAAMGRPYNSAEALRSEAVAKRLSCSYVEGTVRLLVGQRGVGSRAQTCEA
jgi:hypothetical protein